MYSKVLELTGLGLVAYGAGLYLGTAAGLICAGLALLFVGGVTDDAAVGLAIRRGAGWVRYYWHRQLLRENLGQGLTDEPQSPHPPIEIDPELEILAQRLAADRIRRGDGKTKQGVP